MTFGELLWNGGLELFMGGMLVGTSIPTFRKLWKNRRRITITFNKK